MKKVPSKIAVESILYHVRGDQKVRVEDYESEWDVSDRRNPTILYEGDARSLSGYKMWRTNRAEVHSFHVEKDLSGELVMVFCVSTKFEAF